MDISQYDYFLPESQIAQHPTVDRTSSRLLVVGRSKADFRDLQFSNIIELLMPDDLLVVNNTRVLPARLFGHKPTGGKVEIMLERILSDTIALVMLGSNKPVSIGQSILISDIVLTVKCRQGQFFELQFPEQLKAIDAFDRWGTMPLPPYISRQVMSSDQKRYQTVYSKIPGAVAAPTAGLHFSEALIEEITHKGVSWGTITLHVGAGTFQPVRTQNIRCHQMHREWIEVDRKVCEQIQQTRSRGGRVIAVGTTVVRALESAAQSGDLISSSKDTDLFILPGFEFNVVDALVTNFHLPRSTLLMMVSAFAGYEKVMTAYNYAIDNNFRFYSYGDAMFLERQKQNLS